MRGNLGPFGARTRGTVIAILLTFALVSAGSAIISVWTTSRSKDKSTVIQVAARQRTLSERYISEVGLLRAGQPADPKLVGQWLTQSAQALLNGGSVPAVNGDDDETTIPAATDPVLRGQLTEAQRLVSDLTRTGSALLAHRPVNAVRLTGGERLLVTDPIERLRVLAALTSNVSLNAARTIGTSSDNNISNLITLQVGLGVGGLIVSLLLAWALMAATRRQTAHFQSLVTSSTDLVLVFGSGGCRYVSESVSTMIGRPKLDLIGHGYIDFVHEDDRERVEHALGNGGAGRDPLPDAERARRVAPPRRPPDQPARRPLRERDRAQRPRHQRPRRARGGADQAGAARQLRQPARRGARDGRRGGRP